MGSVGGVLVIGAAAMIYRHVVRKRVAQEQLVLNGDVQQQPPIYSMISQLQTMQMAGQLPPFLLNSQGIVGYRPVSGTSPSQFYPLSLSPSLGVPSSNTNSWMNNTTAASAPQSPEAVEAGVQGE